MNPLKLKPYKIYDRFTSPFIFNSFLIVFLQFLMLPLSSTFLVFGFVETYNSFLRRRFLFICLVLCILTSECMLAHAFAWSKTMENIQKSWKKCLFHYTHERFMTGSWSKWRKKFVGQRLGVTPKSWLTPKCGKGTFFMIFECFSSFLTMQTYAQACNWWSKYTAV